MGLRWLVALAVTGVPIGNVLANSNTIAKGTNLTKQLDCLTIDLSDNHSTDRVTLYYGNALPAILCGYHASRLTQADYLLLDKGITK